MVGPMSDERRLIAALKKIATDPAARGLSDDTALLGDLVITHDMIAQGVHFRADDPPASIGWKLAAVNLSDLAAKGATPKAALMGASLSGDADWDEAFVSGLAAACETYGMALIGGDTIALPDGAPLVFGLTAIGTAHPAGTPGRDGARVGDQLILIGTLGDAAAGLAVLTADGKATGPLVEAYRRPVPLIAAGQALAGLAHATMDVSDGLLIDAARMAEASGVQFRIDLDTLPLGTAYAALAGTSREARIDAARGGDDYALLAALPAAAIEALGNCLPPGSIMTRIGEVRAGEGLALIDADGDVPMPERLGYEHRP